MTTPFTLPYAVALAARLKKAGSALIIYDLYPDTLVMAGFMGVSSMLTRGFRSANKTIIRWFDAIVVIGRDMSRKIIRAEDVGWVVPPEGPVAIAAAITEAASNSGARHGKPIGGGRDCFAPYPRNYPRLLSPSHEHVIEPVATSAMPSLFVD
ncbi:hypothetical protein [Bradyrhizobium sp. OAE829]|uniref:hypothetical protein n=1 Tax=Bradyrhizobium sp. OAE829 TaxID=2663807 RepID=UPI0017891FDA